MTALGTAPTLVPKSTVIHGNPWLSATPRGARWRSTNRLLEPAVGHPLWTDWSQIRCPILVVSGEKGSLSEAEVSQMRATNGNAQFRRIRGAGHDVHLDALDEWLRVLEDFVSDRL